MITNAAFGADGAGDPTISGVTSNNVPGNSAALQPNGDLVIVGEFGTLTLSANGDYDYDVPANTITAGGSEVFTYTIVDNDGDPITATLTIAVSPVELAPDNRDVTVNEAALDTAQDGSDLAAGSVTGSNPTSTAETITGQLNVGGAIDYQLVSFTDNNGEFQLNADGSFTYTLTDPVDGPDADNDPTNDATVLNLNPCLSVYNEFSPNGDGVNDFFKINCIEDYPNNTVQIMNRWGNTVYEVGGYNNNDVSFQGISQGRANVSVDEELPTGSYFYVIDLGNGERVKKGWLYLNR